MSSQKVGLKPDQDQELLAYDVQNKHVLILA